MIVCPNCKHENPEGATSCEACYTALPATKACPTCGAPAQLDATFCGQCGQNLSISAPTSPPPAAPVPASSSLPPTVLTNHEVNLPAISSPPAIIEAPAIESPSFESLAAPEVSEPIPPAVPPELANPPAPASPVVEIPAIETPPPPMVATQIQQVLHQLTHLQTNTVLEIPPQLQVIHIGKPNDQVAPDIDVSGFPSAEVVSRVHALMRVEGADYYIEDIGSANGTYINHNILAKGNRHLLQPGDRIGLGKGDLVTFIFQ